MYIKFLTLRKELLVYSNYEYKFTINTDLIFGSLRDKKKNAYHLMLFVGCRSGTLNTNALRTQLWRNLGNAENGARKN
jgi:hypothetical protein